MPKSSDCSLPPSPNAQLGATHWSSRMLATKLGLSQSTVSRIWRAFGLQPHREETFKLSTDPVFIDKVCSIPMMARAL